MQHAVVRSIALCLAGTLWYPPWATGENWPGWRGPRGDGTSLENEIPTEWDASTGTNVAWKVAVPGEGHSSPIVQNDRVFAASCLTDSQQRILVCLDRRDGRTIWQKVVVTAPLETRHELNSHASGTPATDGENVYVAFLEVDGATVPAPNVGRSRPVTPGRVVVAAFDFDGSLTWKTHVGQFVCAHGFCSCPVVYGNLLIVNGDHDGDSWIAALDRRTGKTVWSTSREHRTRSYVTPIIRNIDGRDQLVFSGSMRIVSLDPADGSRIWTIEGPTEQFVASMVFDGRHFFMVAGYPTHHVMAIRPDGRGDVTDTHVTWHATNARCYVPSPVVVDRFLLVADDRGTANCFDTHSGKRYWQDRFGRHFSASLVTAGGLVYFLADDGVMKVVEPAESAKVVATNRLDETCSASPAIAHGQLFIRGEKNLYCIANQHERAAEATGD